MALGSKDEYVFKDSDDEKGKQCKISKENILLILLISSVILGFFFGWLFGKLFDFTPEQIDYISFPGDIFMNMLKMMILPLIFSSLVSSLASLDSSMSGKLGIRAVVYYISTTIIAVFLGILLVLTIRPGEISGDVGESSEEEASVGTAYAFMDLIRSMFPSNLVEATFRTYKTEMQEEAIEPTMAMIVNTGMDYVIVYHTNSTAATLYVGVMSDSMNILGIVVFAIVFGVAIARVGEDGKVVVNFFGATNEAIMKLVTVIMWYAPIGILFLITGSMIEVEDWGELFAKLGAYMGTVVAGLFIHGFIILPLLYFVFTRKNPYAFLINVSSAFMTALGTSSSSATLPVTTRCLEEKNGIDRRVSRFMLPIGATINMDGTALYEAVAAIFIAQINNIPLNVGQIITISLTATFASIGAAGIPQAGLVTMVIVLTAVNLPTNDIALILAVDFILDRLRTVVNVEGDSIGAGIVNHMSQDILNQSDDQDKKMEQNDVESGGHYNNGFNGTVELKETRYDEKKDLAVETKVKT
ncbi:excitatory amino acid transporter 3-like [Antedon mediterranea]|uniref:excitatory amino acid transporter 3-like n=1 Tax=Antedon mediterranea TaxID=105859 RepID=UPI003AF9D410